MVRKFVEYSVKNGIDIIRIFDALNDARNLEVAIDETVKQGAHASGTICFTTSPVHTLEKNVQMVKDLKKMGVSSICIKDMVGIMGPKDAYDLVSAIKDAVPELPLVIHTHCTTGLAFMTCLKSVEVGADVLDTAISPCRRHRPACHRDTGLCPAPARLSGGPGQGSDSDGRLLQGRSGRLPEGRHPGSHLHGHRYPVPELSDPGGMLSNLISQLKMMNAMDKLDEAPAETPKVRADLGYPPGHPTSQMVGSQGCAERAAERYKVVGKEIKAYCRGRVRPHSRPHRRGDPEEDPGRHPW